MSCKIDMVIVWGRCIKPLVRKNFQSWQLQIHWITKAIKPKDKELLNHPFSFIQNKRRTIEDNQFMNHLVVNQR